VVFSILFYALKVGVAAWGNKSVRIKKRRSRHAGRVIESAAMFND
jgi:hypothetical protein